MSHLYKHLIYGHSGEATYQLKELFAHVIL